MTIRSCVASDAAAIEAMFLEFVAELRAIGDTTPYSFGAEQYLRDGFGLDPAFRGLIAEDASGAAGYLLFAKTYEDDYVRGLHMVDLFVRRASRGKGVARMLMAAVADVARAEGAVRLTWAVYKGNARARRFYEKLGATTEGDADVMSLEV